MTGLPPLGAHCSIAGGLPEALRRAEAIGASALQIFTGQPQRWAARPLSDEEEEAFREAWAAGPVRFVVAHDSYLINLASPDDALRRRSTAAFRGELVRAARLGLDAVVSHPGNATDGRREAGLRRNAEALAAALREVPEAPPVLLETTAGSGNALGWRFEELARILELLPEEERKRVGVCLDTAHVHAAGYDLAGDYAGVMRGLEAAVGLERLRLVHVNDSRVEKGSRVDRHEHVGKGTVGEAAFRALMRDPALQDVPRVIETPKGDDATAMDRRNLDRLRALATA